MHGAHDIIYRLDDQALGPIMAEDSMNKNRLATHKQDPEKLEVSISRLDGLATKIPRSARDVHAHLGQCEATMMIVN